MIYHHPFQHTSVSEFMELKNILIFLTQIANLYDYKFDKKHDSNMVKNWVDSRSIYMGYNIA